jgi:hypothetical protein
LRLGSLISGKSHNRSLLNLLGAPEVLPALDNLDEFFDCVSSAPRCESAEFAVDRIPRNQEKLVNPVTNTLLSLTIAGP